MVSCRLAAHAVGHDPATQHAGDRAQAGPGGVAHQPEALDAEVVRDGVLVGVGQRLAYAADRARRPPREPLVRARGADLADDGPLPQAGKRPPRVPGQALADRTLTGLVLGLGEVLPRGQPGVRGDHYSAVTGWRAEQV